MNNKKARVIAFYLPQFHPIPENDKWWGKGFTEWTNVAKAKPLFKGHLQPRIPADLGFYDLRMSEVREAQANLAREAGIEGFCYWHYWFGNGKMLLERPFKEVLESGSPNFPFCLGWANHSWTNKTWDKAKRFTPTGILQEQKYLGEEDYTNHFYYVLNAFKDKRYIRVDDKPVFVVFAPLAIPNVKIFIDLWNSLAIKNGLKGIHFVGIVGNSSTRSIRNNGSRLSYSLLSNNKVAKERYNHIIGLGFDAVNSRGQHRAEMLTKGSIKRILIRFVNEKFDGLIVDKYKYKDIIKHLYVEEDKWENVYPTIIPNYDRSPRIGKKHNIWYGSTPKLFGENIVDALKLVENKNDEHKLIFLKSWNEWAETNFVEPDIVFGKGYLEILASKLFK